MGLLVENAFDHKWKYGQLTIIATNSPDKVKPTYATTRVATEDRNLTATTSGARVLESKQVARSHGLA